MRLPRGRLPRTLRDRGAMEATDDDKEHKQSPGNVDADATDAPWEHQNAWNRGRTRHLLGVLLGCKLWESKALVHVYAAQCMSIHRLHRA